MRKELAAFLTGTIPSDEEKTFQEEGAVEFRLSLYYIQRFVEEFDPDEDANSVLLVAAKHAEELLRKSKQLNSDFYKAAAAELIPVFKRGFQFKFPMVEDQGVQLELWRDSIDTSSG